MNSYINSSSVSFAFDSTAIVYNMEANKSLEGLIEDIQGLDKELNPVEAKFIAEVLFKNNMIPNYKRHLTTYGNLITRNVEFDRFKELLEYFEETLEDCNGDGYVIVTQKSQDIRKELLNFVQELLVKTYKQPQIDNNK